MVDKLLLPPEEAFGLIGVKKAKGYKMLSSGELPSFKVGRLRRIPLEALRRWVKERTDAALAERERTDG